nr:type IV pilin protein [Neisseria sp. 74A18]
MVHTQRGFTLTELLFTIAILAVLAAIAIPVYQKYIKNTRLHEAHTALIKNAQMMEQFYQQHRSFKLNSTTWPPLPETSTGHFCIRPQGVARGAHDDKFTLKAVAFDKNNEPRVLKINESLIAIVCESSASSCSDENHFFKGKSADKDCRIYSN